MQDTNSSRSCTKFYYSTILWNHNKCTFDDMYVIVIYTPREVMHSAIKVSYLIGKLKFPKYKVTTKNPQILIAVFLSCFTKTLDSDVF